MPAEAAVLRPAAAPESGDGSGIDGEVLASRVLRTAAVRRCQRGDGLITEIADAGGGKQGEGLRAPARVVMAVASMVPEVLASRVLRTAAVRRCQRG